MTGIERLRELSKGMHNHRVTVWQLTDDAYAERFGVTKHGPTIKNFLSDIADQIEREHAEVCFRMGVRAADVSMSAYDLLPADERETIAWVREHGGLDHVKAEWRSRSNLKRQLERARAKVERQQRHIEFVQGKCRERQGHIVELSKELAELRKVLSDYRDALGGMCERLGITDGTSLPEMPDVICEALDRRLMPEGREWPRYESGEPVRFGDEFLDHQGNVRSVLSVKMFQEGGFEIGTGQGTYDWHSAGEPVRRPAVLAADGEPLEVGQTVYVIANGKTHHVTEIDTVSKCFRSMEQVDGSHWLDPMCFTHQRPVLDADGVPIREDERVFGINGGLYRVTSAHDGKVFARYVNGPFGAEVESAGGEGLYRLRADQLTHTKPEPPDSWERVEEDATLSVNAYRERYGIKKHDGMTWPQLVREDLVRRCRALAERERGE